MPFPKYNPFYIKGTLKPTLPNPFRALLHFFSFKSFFNFFSSITILNIFFIYFTIFSPTPMLITLNYYICQVITCLN